MIRISERISFRPYGPGDEELWRSIFFDSVREHFDPLGLPPGDLDALLFNQFVAQTADYRANYPQASNMIIVHEGADIGRIIWSTEHGDLHLIDLTVLTPYRGRGVGSELLKWIFGLSRESGLSVRFYVEKGNRAMRLYERLGFRNVEDVVSHFRMEWRP